MYKRVFTALAAAVIAALLLFALGPLGADAVSDPRNHIVAHAY